MFITSRYNIFKDKGKEVLKVSTTGNLIMKKEKMLTHSLVTTHFSALAYSFRTKDIVEYYDTYVGDLSDLEIEMRFNNENANYYKFIKLIKAEKMERIYGIFEKDFLEFAVELDNETCNLKLNVEVED